MKRLRHLLLVGLLAGAISGSLATAVQAMTVLPLIARAETLEGGEHTRPAHEHADHAAHSGFERLGRTLLFNSLAGIGFGLLLAAVYGARGGTTFVASVAWGAAGFVAFGLAPAIGLPPTLPGGDLAELGSRQLWWLGTAIATAVGLAAIFLTRAALVQLLGLALIVLPHLIGAPQPAVRFGGPPADMARAFELWCLVSLAVFWVVLGAVSGWLFDRWMPRDNQAA